MVVATMAATMDLLHRPQVFDAIDARPIKFAFGISVGCTSCFYAVIFNANLSTIAQTNLAQSTYLSSLPNSNP